MTLGRRSSFKGRFLVDALRLGMQLFATFEEVVLVVAPPRMGKTAWIGNPIIDAPGACVATSTKAELFHDTARLRARRGPVVVFNPEGLSGLDSTLRWSPIAGCHRPNTAIRRAADLLAGAPSSAGTDERSFWEGSNNKVLRCLLMAAALGDKTMVDLHGWITTKSREPLSILQTDLRAPRSWTEALNQVLITETSKTLDSIYQTLELAFAFMADPEIATTVCPGPEDEAFDPQSFIKSKGTLYLFAEESKEGTVAPVFTALTGELFHAAKRMSQSYPGGRLDPPPVLALDEAALICPVPLARWTSDAGGRGITLLVAIQGPSQLRERWGHATAATVWNNAGVTMVMGGHRDGDTLHALSSLCDRPAPATEQSGENGSRSTSLNPSQRVPVLTPAQLRTLPDERALVIARNERPVVVRIHPLWKRRDVRASVNEPLPELRPAPVATPETAEEEVASIVPMRAVAPGEADDDIAAEA